MGGVGLGRSLQFLCTVLFTKEKIFVSSSFCQATCEGDYLEFHLLMPQQAATTLCRGVPLHIGLESFDLVLKNKNKSLFLDFEPETITNQTSSCNSTEVRFAKKISGGFTMTVINPVLDLILKYKNVFTKAKLHQEGIFFHTLIPSLEILLSKLEIKLN